MPTMLVHVQFWPPCPRARRTRVFGQCRVMYAASCALLCTCRRHSFTSLSQRPRCVRVACPDGWLLVCSLRLLGMCVVVFVFSLFFGRENCLSHVLCSRSCYSLSVCTYLLLSLILVARFLASSISCALRVVFHVERGFTALLEQVVLVEPIMSISKSQIL